jgi:hypothetical protein
MKFTAEELGTAGARHAFDLLGMWTHHSGARQVLLSTSDDHVRRAMCERLTLPLTDDRAEIALYPFTLERLEPVFDTPLIAGCFRNRWSYRKLLHPFMTVCSLPGLRAVLRRQGYALEKLTGIYPPMFMLWWTIGLFAGIRLPSFRFRWEQTAMNHLATARLPGLAFSYLIVFYARRLDI